MSPWQRPGDKETRPTSCKGWPATSIASPGAPARMIFNEVGAPIGTFPLSVATLNYSVAAFEPFLDNLRRVKYSICLDGLQNRLMVFTVALGERKHMCCLFTSAPQTRKTAWFTAAKNSGRISGETQISQPYLFLSDRKYTAPDERILGRGS